MTDKKAGLLDFTAVFMYCAATFQIVDEKIVSGALLFGAASCFAAIAGIQRKKEVDKQSKPGQIRRWFMEDK